MSLHASCLGAEYRIRVGLLNLLCICHEGLDTMPCHSPSQEYIVLFL